MTDFDPEGLGRRLKYELDTSGLDVKALQEKVRTQSGKARGTSYGSVWSYVNGQAPLEPRREVIEAMATVLGVLPSYLLAGGARTPEAKAAGDLARDIEPADDPLSDILDIVFPEYADFGIEAQSILIAALERFSDAAPRNWFPPDDHTRAYAVHVTAFLAVARQSVFMPLWAWDDAPDLTKRSVQDYLRAALTAFVASIPERLPREPVFRVDCMGDGQFVPLNQYQEDEDASP